MNPFRVGRRATFTRNILSMTRCKILSSAFKGWKVLRLVHLSTADRMASCEICGARFREGALMRHANGKVTVTVGGICARTIRAAAFGTSAKYRFRQQQTWRVFREYYGDRFARGAWLTWMVANAPPRLAPLVLDLRQLGAVRSDADMHRLIRFHDSHRRYPARALVEDLAALRRAGLRGVPEYLTLDRARRIVALAAAKLGMAPARVRSRRYGEDEVRPFVRASRGRTAAWKRLPALGQRAVRALAALSEEGREAVTPPELAMQFESAEPAARSGQFIWNPYMGLGFVERSGYRGNGTAFVWFWKRAREARRPFDLRFFRSVVPLETGVIAEVERLAFGEGAKKIGHA